MECWSNLVYIWRGPIRVNLPSSQDPWKPGVRGSTYDRNPEWKVGMKKKGNSLRLVWRDVERIYPVSPFNLNIRTVSLLIKQSSQACIYSWGENGQFIFERTEGTIWELLFHLCGMFILILVFNNKDFSF